MHTMIRKTCDGRFVGKVGGWEILRNGGDPSNGGDDFEMGGLIPLYGLCYSNLTKIVP